MNKTNIMGTNGEVKIPPPPKISELEEDIRSVLALDVPVVDKSRKFPGLEKQKIEKKDRHVKAVDAFGVLLEEISEKLEKEVLDKSREIRENLEAIDEKLESYYQKLEDDDFLTVRSELQLIDILGELKGVLKTRTDSIDQFAFDLNAIETKRADIVGSELKKYTDRLIGIAHQLPDDIEHIIETETFELNSVLTKNKQAYAQLVGLINKTNIEVEVETLQRWEDSREHWRQLRHAKGLKDFISDINSDTYRDPQDRQEFMKNVRANQQARHDERIALLGQLSNLNAKTINSEEIVKIQSQFSAIHDVGLEEIQSCYNGLGELRIVLQDLAKSRVEDLRKELHTYGALKEEPKLRDISDIFQHALENPDMAELWRLGGGMKTEFQNLMSELRHVNVVYEDHVNTMQSRIEVIVCGFDLKNVLEERGRLVQLEKIRNLLVKMRSVAREDVPEVLLNLMPELEENLEIERLPVIFHNEIKECLNDMKRELQKIGDFNDPNEDRTSKSSAHASTRGVTTAKTMLPGTTGGKTNKNNIIDPLCVRHWNRRLGMLYYGSDLPDEYRSACTDALSGILRQRDCNALIDKVIHSNCDKPLKLIEKGYKKLMDNIATFLESQANYISVNVTNIGHFYLLVSKMMEKHRKLQHELDEQAMDELFDKSEDFRLEREDREEEFEQACVLLRKSTDHEELAVHFENVLSILSVIQDSYRKYHERACFVCDKHPLSLINEFRTHMVQLCKRFEMSPIQPHFVLDHFDRLYEKIKKFNANIIEADPSLLEQLPAVEIELPEPLPVEEGSVATSATASTGSSSKKSKKEIREFVGEYEPPMEKRYLEQVKIEEKRLFAQGGSAAVAAAGGVVVEKSPTRKTSQSSGGKVSKLKNVTKNVIAGNKVLNAFGNTRVLPRPTMVIKGVDRGGIYGLVRREAVVVEHLTLETTMQELEDEVTREDAPPASASTSALTPGESAEGLNGVTETENNANAATEAGETEADPEHAVAEGEKTPPDEGGNSEEDEVLPVIEEPEIVVHEDKPWLQQTIILKTPEELLDCDDDDMFLYNQKIMKGFVKLTDEAMEMLTPEQKSEYENFQKMMNEVNDRLTLEADPAYIRSNVPKDCHGECWVLDLEINQKKLLQIISNLKDSLFDSMECEVHRRLAVAEELCKSRIDELTEEFEDRLRTHWPRRGRVETQIKQPRETELLTHEEKTWRLVQDIQQKMVSIQNTFYNEIASAKKDCDKYISDINVLKSSLTNVVYKTLAPLQGVDVRARSTTIAFQRSCLQSITYITKVCEEDTAAVIQFAQDFRRICPPQEPGKDGGYSETEINEIQNLVDGQCEEIHTLVNTWKDEIESIKEQQSQSILCHDEFCQKYEKCTQELAMSEGLGQKYGAPRRRAQERLRTEVSRDEQSAGFVDELLAKLEFYCLEKQRLMAEMGDDVIGPEDEDDEGPATPNHASTKKTAKAKAVVPIGASSNAHGNGSHEFQIVQDIWKLCIQLRAVLAQRIEYLEIVGDKKIPVIPLIWIDSKRIGMFIGNQNQESHEGMESSVAVGENAETSNEYDAPVSPRYLRAGVSCLTVVVANSDALCRKETRDLYTSEGKLDMLPPDSPDSVPESLEIWLAEAKEKILGRNGYRERAWKRLWSQVDRLEIILCRKSMSIVNLAIQEAANNPNSVNTRIGVGAPAVCMRYLSESYLAYIKLEQQTKMDLFSKSIRVWVKGRDKHERLLRPRLGSPDAVNELEQLDAIELQRSQEMIQGIVSFRHSVLKRLVEFTMVVLEDIATSSKSFLIYTDTSLTQDAIQVPPDTAIPKVRMTLKRLRKAERIKNAIEKGQEDNTTMRVWDGLNMEQFLECVQSINHMNQTDVKDMEEMKEWANDMYKNTCVRAMVSTAHRSLVNERNRAVKVYLQNIMELIHSYLDNFATYLQQEHSWNARWQRQVNMLRDGNI